MDECLELRELATVLLRFEVEVFVRKVNDAGGGIRTHEPLRDEVLSLAPLTRLGDPRSGEPVRAETITVYPAVAPSVLGRSFRMNLSYSFSQSS